MVDAFVCLQYFHLQQGDGGGSLTRGTIGFFDTSGEQYLAQITHITDVSCTFRQTKAGNKKKGKYQD